MTVKIIIHLSDCHTPTGFCLGSGEAWFESNSWVPDRSQLPSAGRLQLGYVLAYRQTCRAIIIIITEVIRPYLINLLFIWCGD